jgi:hypothetical protein
MWFRPKHWPDLLGKARQEAPRPKRRSKTVEEILAE